MPSLSFEHLRTFLLPFYLDGRNVLCLGWGLGRGIDLSWNDQFAVNTVSHISLRCFIGRR